MTCTVLLIDPAGRMVDVVRDVVERVDGLRLDRANDATEALRRISEGAASLLMISLGSPADVEAASQLLANVASWPVAVPILFLSETDDPGVRFRLIKQGAVDCLGRPLNISRLAMMVDLLTVRPRYEARDAEQTAQAAAHAAETEREVIQVGEFLFESPAMRKLFPQVRSVAALQTTVLLDGETGTGKTQLAGVIHALSPRHAKPFVVVHCGTLSSGLLESELFGHVRGAFTHAVSDRAGRLAEARDGTILLDEIDCVPFECQAKLLRAVEERVFEPVGSAKSQPMRARLLAASNRDLGQLVAEGRFRADLFYRLNVVSFRLPPLRERKELIEPLAERLVAEFCHRNGQWACSVSMGALDAMMAYDWPGNIRELRNVIERATAFCAGRMIEVEDLPEPLRKAASSVIERNIPIDAPQLDSTPCGNQLARARDEAERGQLNGALTHCGNNRSHAAAHLGVSRKTLYKKLRRYGLV